MPSADLCGCRNKKTQIATAKMPLYTRDNAVRNINMDNEVFIDGARGETRTLTPCGTGT